MDRSSASFSKLALLGLPLLLGLTGFLSAGESFLNALFNSISLYAMNYQDTPPNLWIEAGRWTAPLATLSGIFMAFSAIRKRIMAYLRYRRGDSVAVYGPEPEKTLLLNQLGSRGIDGGDRFVRAQRYILLDEDNFAFYTQNQEALKHSETYLKCSVLPAQSVSVPGLYLFCPEETAARLFWKQMNLYEQSVAREHRMNIVFLGFGRLGAELLFHGLQDNIFAPDQQITYHIFGAEDSFPATHTQLKSISDPVLFNDEPWYTQLPLLEGADVVVVLEQNDQMALLQSLLLSTNRSQFHVFASEHMGIHLLAGQDRLNIIPWQQAQSLEHILSDMLYRRAKRINLRYAHLYGGIVENERNQEEQWALLDAFTRYSNISAADYHEIRLSMLKTMGVAADGASVSPQLLELLAELEHIRWCRYHYLNNWRQGVPENGKRKDPALRIHADLIPYQELTDGEKEKDRENIRILLSIR